MSKSIDLALAIIYIIMQDERYGKLTVCTSKQYLLTSTVTCRIT